MCSKYKAIFFDFDGVILDTLEAKGKAFARLYTTKTDDQIFKSIMTFHLTNGGMNRVEKIKRIHQLLKLEEITETELNNKLEELKHYMKEVLLDCGPIDNYIVPLIKDLSTYVPLWVVSAAPRDELLFLCDNLKITSYFKEILGNCKKTEVIKELLQKINLSSNEVLFIGDAEEDFKASSANNVPFVLKLNSNNKTLFSQNFSGLTINSFNELGPHL